MIITAKFASVCPCCSARIDVGTKVEWSKGSKARHVTCASAPGAMSAPSAPARRSYGSRYRDGSGRGSAPSVPGYSSYCTDRPGCGCYDCAS